MKSSAAWRVGLYCLLVCAALTAAGDALAQATLPGDPTIIAAADQLNAVTPQAVPAQTIFVGSFNASSGTFTWAIPGSYPAGTLPAKESVEGGPVQPEHVPVINSYDVTYRFDLVDASDLTVTLSLPNAAGGTDTTSATGSSTAALTHLPCQGCTAHGGGGTVTTSTTPAVSPPGGSTSGTLGLPFHPVTLGQETVQFGSGYQIELEPQLAPQLGAFVVPYQLIGIIYEPPGAGSTAQFSTSSTVGSTTTWGFESSTGLVSTENPSQFDDLANQGLDAAIGLASPVAAKVAGVIASLASGQVDTITSQTTTGESDSLGSTLTLTLGYEIGQTPYQPDPYAYGGRGDVFVVLHDVLWAYVVKDGRVLLSPLAYSGVQTLYGGDLMGALPAGVADAFLALDPFSAEPSTSAADKLGPAATGALSAIHFTSAPSLPASRFVLYQPLEHAACTDIPSIYQLSSTELSSASTSQVASETDVSQQTGLVASIEGTPDTLWGYTQSTSASQLSGQGSSATVTLQCASNDQVEDTIYYDTLFKTFLTVQGPALAPEAEASGALDTPAGQPAPDREVTLTVAGETYGAMTEANGEFSFRIPGLPKGKATLSAGGQTVPISLAATPLTGLKITSAAGRPDRKG